VTLALLTDETFKRTPQIGPWYKHMDEMAVMALLNANHTSAADEVFSPWSAPRPRKSGIEAHGSGPGQEGPASQCSFGGRRMALNFCTWSFSAERICGWINRNRRLAKDFETTIASAETFLHAASVMLLARRLAQS
jgi:hypothetical protein